MKIIKVLSIIIIGVLILGVTVSCGQDDLQEQIDILTTQLTDANSQVADLQQKLFEAQTLESQYDALEDQYADLQAKNEGNLEQIDTLGDTIEQLDMQVNQLTGTNAAQVAEIAEIHQEYDSLKAQYDLLLGLEAGISVESIEQALFELINQERISYGLNALQPGTNLRDWALANCQAMAVSKEFEYYEKTWVPFQRVFIAAGYSSLDTLVNGAMMTWQSHALFYQDNVLDEDALYGTVRAVQSGNIYYITFLASNYP
jgi:uncharacterized protein YkwD